MLYFYNGNTNTWQPICTFAYLPYDLSTYLLPPVERAQTQRIGVVYQQPLGQVKGQTVQLQSLERTFKPILAGHSMDDTILAATELTVPALDQFLSLELLTHTKRRVSLLDDRMLDMMQQARSVQLLCDQAVATPPQLTHMQTAFFVHANFRTSDFGASTDGLYDSVSLYTFCPRDTTALSYKAAVEEASRLHQDSFINTRTSTTAGVVGRVNSAKTVQCLISALVFMSSAIKSLAYFQDDNFHPVLCTALEYMATVLSSRTLQEKARAMPSQLHLRTHFIMNIIQGNIGAFFELAMGAEAKRRACQATINTDFFQPALAGLSNFEEKVLELFQLNLSTSLKPITYTAETAVAVRSSAAGRDPVAPRRAPTNTQAPRAQRPRTALTLSRAEYTMATATGFVRKCNNNTSNETWARLINGWNIQSQCCFFSVHGFYCTHGACGTIGGTCPKRHRKWSQLPENLQDKVKALIARFPGDVKLDVSR